MNWNGSKRKRSHPSATIINRRKGRKQDKKALELQKLLLGMGRKND